MLKRTKNWVLVQWWSYSDKFSSSVNVKDLVWFSCDHSVAFLELFPTVDDSDEKGGNLVLWGRLFACGKWYNWQHDDFILSVMENGNGSGRALCCCHMEVGFPKPKLSTSVKCYSFHPLFWPAFTAWSQQGDQQLWVVLLSSCMGYLEPNPVISISFSPTTVPSIAIHKIL